MVTSRLASLMASVISYGASQVLGVTLSEQSAAALAHFDSVDLAISRLELRVASAPDNPAGAGEMTTAFVVTAVADAVAEARVYSAGTERMRELMHMYFDADVVLNRLPEAVAARGTVPQLLDDLRRHGSHMWFFEDVERLYNTLHRKLTLSIESDTVRRRHALALDGLFREHLAMVSAAIGGA